jgi:peroxiredoxin
MLDTEGRSVVLGSLFGARPLVLVFLRHFGCLFAKQQTDELKRHHAALRSAGADVVAIGNGQLEEARVFEAEQALPFKLLTDPTGESYCAVDLRRGLGTALRPSVLLRALRATVAGFHQTKTAGDPLQQGGVLVFSPGGHEIYRYVSSSAGDHPSMTAVLRVLSR